MASRGGEEGGGGASLRRQSCVAGWVARRGRGDARAEDEGAAPDVGLPLAARDAGDGAPEVPVAERDVAAVAPRDRGCEVAGLLREMAGG